ncbi:hypothetical protein ECG_05756 [Echinococcus granulosus]|nr:hypothetical protein ECG_05756 [Echinococcus granulosus]
MRISPLSFTLLCLLVLVVVSTADAKRGSRVGGAAALKKKSDFGGKKGEKPNSLRLKLGSGLMKGAAKTGLNRITRNVLLKKGRKSGFGPLSSIRLLCLPIALILY